MLEKQGTKIDKVLNFAIDDAILEERITGRWIHPSSGRTYHTKFAPPKVPGVDDVRIDDISFLTVRIIHFLVFSMLIGSYDETEDHYFCTFFGMCNFYYLKFMYKLSTYLKPFVF